MPPQLALLGCLVFIFFAFAVHLKTKPDVSPALWVPSIWMALLASRPVSLWLNPRVVARDAEGTTLEAVTYALFILSSFLIIHARGIDWSRVLRQNRALLAFAVYVGLSVLWADDPFAAFKRYVKFLGMIFIALVVLTEQNPVEAIKTMARRAAYVLIPASIMLIKYYPGIGTRYEEWTGNMMVTGVTLHKNGLGVLSMIVALIFFWILFRGTSRAASRTARVEFILDCFILLLALHLLRIADSKTSLVCFLVGGTLFLTLRLGWVKKRAGVYIAVATAALLLMQWSFGLFEWILQMLGRSPTLTNRTLIWQELLPHARNVLFGAGYESFWTDQMRQQMTEAGLRATVSHNAFLEIYLNLGLIGLSLYLGFLAAAYLHSKKLLRSDFNFGRFAYAMVVVVILYSIPETPKGLSLSLLMLYLVGLEMTPSRPRARPDSNRNVTAVHMRPSITRPMPQRSATPGA
jgi:exopolysaccharide production protein ExoQ